MSEQSKALESVDRFLGRFFATPNRFILADIESGNGRHVEALRPWIELLRAPERHPTVLPRWRGDGKVEWYGIAFSERQLRALSEDLLAFVGPTYSTFRGARSEFVRSDQIDAAVLEFTKGHALKFLAPPGQEAGAALLAALDLMRGVQHRRPVEVSGVPRPTGRVLRDLFIALRAGDRNSAERHLRYLADEFRLDPINLIFLRVQALAELGDWVGLIRSPEMPDLLRMRRPLAVTDALIRAVYFHELANFEHESNASGAIAHFSEAVLPRYGALFTSRASLHSPEVLKAFMLVAVAGPVTSPKLRDEILAVAAELPGDHVYLKALAATLHAHTPARTKTADVVAKAIAAEHRGDYDAAYVLALAAPQSPDRTRLLIDCGYGLQTLDTMRAAMVALEMSPPNDREAILTDRRRREACTWIESQCAVPGERSPSVPSSWSEWLATVERSPKWPQAQRVARQGSLEWKVVDFLDREAGPHAFATQLHSARDQETVHNALPHLLAFFQSDVAWPQRDLVEVYRAMLEVLVYSMAGADDDFVVFQELAQAILSLGVSEEQYRELLGWVTYLLGQYPSLARIDWGMDVLDLMVVHVAPNPDLRLNVLSAVATQFQRFSSRIQPEQWDMLGSLATELGHPEIIAFMPAGVAASIDNAVQTKAQDPLILLGNRTLAIYTLTESAGQRTRARILERCPNASVKTSHEKVGTERLKQLAQRSDIFLIATASATHAATGFIDAHRRLDSVTLRPTGKGAASMLRCLRDFLRPPTENDR